MQFVSCHNGQIFTSTSHSASGQIGASRLAGTADESRSFRTGLALLDELLPNSAFSRGVIHEVLAEPHAPAPRFFTLLLARAAGGTVVWCDPQRTLYPPAVAAAGLSLERLFLLHPKNEVEQAWAIAECMRCRGVGVTVAQIGGKISRIQARRFQLAAERGGGVGLLLRRFDSAASIYAAATRWLVCPMPGLRTVQRWKIQLIHAHGGRVGKTVILERNRETNSTNIVRATEQLADRPGHASEVA